MADLTSMRPMSEPGEVQAAYRHYLRNTPTYGTYEDRMPEYAVIGRQLQLMLLRPDESVLDVGAGSCDLDHYLRTEVGWRGQYLPVDGSLMGDDLNTWEIPDGVQFDWVVCCEVIEHVYDPERLFGQLVKAARQGLIITTPNPAVVDVYALDPGHVSAISEGDLESWSEKRGVPFAVGGSLNFSNRGGSDEIGWDTLIYVAKF